MRRSDRGSGRRHEFAYLEDGEEDGGLETGLTRETDSHERAPGAEVVDGLRVTRGRCRGHDRRVGAEAASDSLDVGDDVLRLPEVDERLRAELQAELALLITSVYSDIRRSSEMRQEED